MVNKNPSTLKLAAGVVVGALMLILAAAAGFEALQAGDSARGDGALVHRAGRPGDSILFHALVLIWIGTGALFLGGSLTKLRRRLEE